jgi:acyl-CoA reductase-like NAD-dependent aldehyde dehydrogenase
MELAARDFKRVSLNWRKSPTRVRRWRLQVAADASLMSVFDNTGQDCCARSRRSSSANL